MGRKVDVDDLVGAPEIARRLGLAAHQVVHSWRSRYEDFPPPVVEVGRVAVFVWPDVERWARKTGRL